MTAARHRCPGAPGQARRAPPADALDTESAQAAYDNGILTLHIASAAHTKPGKIALSLGARKQLTPWRPSAACPAEILHARQADPYGDTPVVTVALGYHDQTPIRLLNATGCPSGP